VSKIEHKERRLIHLAVARQKGFLRIRVENCCDEEPKLEGENIVTSKSDKRYHGFGVKSIKNTVKKYGGTTDIETNKGWFEIRILIPIP
jgi:sensor histidine kinase regulating citrate/malate metabolism